MLCRGAPARLVSSASWTLLTSLTCASSFSTLISPPSRTFLGSCDTLKQSSQLPVSPLARSFSLSRVRGGSPQTMAVRTPVEAAEEQLKWYNERNVDKFLTVFTDDCQLQDLRTGAILATGKAEIRPRYEKRFSTPIHAKLTGRLNVGNVVTDQEHITGLPDGAEAHVLAVYHVNPEGLINRVQFVWEDVKK